jgi:crossover junction endodeoxyribonuclease RusA
MGISEVNLDLFEAEVPYTGSGVRLTLPWPPSVNHYWGKRVIFPAVIDMQRQVKQHGWDGFFRWIQSRSRVSEYLTTRAKDYQADVMEIVLRARANKHLQGPLRMVVRAFPPDRRERDLSNIYKAVEDALQASGVFESDYQVVEHLARREREVVTAGRVVVILEAAV